ncbi:hypothetical protein DPMN_008709 [Dreissena polymorpha]|uniref:SRCR domain-containing protein n=1 Tax=Dreissena polymorpha TaxID=45954 RepID=A0A9D4MYM9_DREPO|nr:hypothetical protein DPMN_008709 [Dreissena polymorpha]
MLVITDIRKHGDGRVEVQNDLHNSRIALCADQGWNHSEIDVVCRQIGFQGAAESELILTMTRDCGSDFS